MEVEIVNRLGRGLQRHNCRTIANRITLFFTVRVVVYAEGCRKVCCRFRVRAGLFLAARHLAEKRRRSRQPSLGKAVATRIQECGISTRTVCRRLFRRPTVHDQRRMIIAEHQFARYQQALTFFQLFLLRGRFVVDRRQVVELLPDFTLHVVWVNKYKALSECELTRQAQD